MTSNVVRVPGKKSRWGILFAFLYFLLYETIYFAVSIGYSVYLVATCPDEAAFEAAYYRDSNLLMVLMDAVIFLSLSIIVLARGKRYSQGMGMKKTRVETIPVAVLAGIGLSCVLGFLMSYISYLFPKLMEDYNNTMDVTYNMGQIVLYILAGVIGAPLIEELVFRHFLAGNLSKGMPRIGAILISSFLFGLVHQHIVQQVYAAFLGLAMACVYFAYDSVWASIALHAGFNAVSLLSLIDTSHWSEAQQLRFVSIVNVSYLALAVVGILALVWLFVRRTHPVWKNESPQTVVPAGADPSFAPPPSALQWAAPASTPIRTIPTVSELSKTLRLTPPNPPHPLPSEANEPTKEGEE